jgi:large subunit ribosomal protein L19
MGLMEKVEAAYFKTDRPQLRPGQTVEVSVRVIEGDKERQQKFRGEIINVRGSGLRKTFTVRKISEGVGVERTFPLHGPSVGEVKVLKHSKVRRAKLFYLRRKTGKAARLTEKKKTGETAPAK